jgi:hypothetical protein
MNTTNITSKQWIIITKNVVQMLFLLCKIIIFYRFTSQMQICMRKQLVISKAASFLQYWSESFLQKQKAMEQWKILVTASGTSRIFFCFYVWTLLGYILSERHVYIFVVSIQFLIFFNIIRPISIYKKEIFSLRRIILKFSDLNPVCWKIGLCNRKMYFFNGLHFHIQESLKLCTF